MTITFHCYFQCLLSTFFLSAFFQLHVIAPIFLVPLHYSATWGLIFNSVIFIGTSFVKVVPKLYFDYKLIPFEVSQLDELMEIKQSFFRFFTYTDQYIYLFILGIMAGFVIRTYPDLLDILTKNRCRTVPLTILSVAVGLYAIIWSENFKYIDKKHNQLDISAWFVCGMIFISILLIWLTILYFKDNGKDFTTFSPFMRLHYKLM